MRHTDRWQWVGCVLRWLFIAGMLAILFALLRESDFVGECVFGLY